MVTRESIQQLIERAGEYSISIYMPTHRMNEAAQQDPIRYKNLLNQAAEKLMEHGMKEEQVEGMLKEPRKLIEDGEFWLHQSDGLAVFCSEDHFEYMRVPIAFDSFVYVDNHYFITPLMPMLTRDGTFYVLRLSKSKVDLLECTSDSQRSVELDDIPRSMEEFQRFDVHEKHLQSGSAGAGAGRNVYHGQGDAATEEKKYVELFVKAVEKGVTRFMRKTEQPLLLCGVEYLNSMYGKANHYSYLLDETVKGSPDHKDDKQLREEAWDIAKEEFLSVIEEERERFADLISTDRSSSDLEEVVKAARYGKVDTLFLPIGHNRWGVFDEEKNEVKLHGSPDGQDKDLFNFAATHVLTKDGNVMALKEENMPQNASIAAIFRY